MDKARTVMVGDARSVVSRKMSRILDRKVRMVHHVPMARSTWRRKVSERWDRNDGTYNGWLRETVHGFEVIDEHGQVVAGPNFDVALVVRMAHDVGVDVRAEDLGNQS